MGDVQLRYEGGASLMFQDGSGRRSVTRGQSFSVDDATAKALLESDPNVVAAGDPAPTPAPTVGAPFPSPDEIGEMKVEDLRTLADEAGVSKAGGKEVLSDRLSAYSAGRAYLGGAAAYQATATPATATPHPTSSEAELVAPPPTGGTLAAPGPTEPASGLTGAITLGDVPDGGKVSKG